MEPVRVEPSACASRRWNRVEPSVSMDRSIGEDVRLLGEQFLEGGRD
jgi:hypothetical protein